MAILKLHPKLGVGQSLNNFAGEFDNFLLALAGGRS